MGRIHSPLNHQMTAIIHRVADTSCAIARVAVAVAVNVRGTHVGIGDSVGGVVRVVRVVNVKVTVQTRRRGTEMGKSIRAGEARPKASTHGWPRRACTLLEDLPKCMRRIAVILIVLCLFLLPWKRL